jgi:RNA polymerase sigma-70 factor (ECF subfamily)
MPDHNVLIRALRAGDPQALESLFETYADRLYRLALGLLGDPFEAEDIVQEAFLKVITRLDNFQERSNLGTWLYRVAYNASIDRLRLRRESPLPEDDPDLDDSLPMPEVLSEWHTPESHLIVGESLEYLDAAIQTLPESLRSVFVLRDIDELSTRETAEVLGITENTVKVRLHRARLALPRASVCLFC